MFLNDLRSLDYDKRFYKLSESLNKDYGIDVSIYDVLNEEDLEYFLLDLDNKRRQIMLESEFNSYHNNPEYTKISLLAEAVRIMLKEIHPKRKSKESVKEGYRTIPGVQSEFPGDGSYDNRVITDKSGIAYSARPGLEGPSVSNDGHVYYYDPKQGEYYDPRSDMFMGRDWNLNESTNRFVAELYFGLDEDIIPFAKKLFVEVYNLDKKISGHTVPIARRAVMFNTANLTETELARAIIETYNNTYLETLNEVNRLNDATNVDIDAIVLSKICENVVNDGHLYKGYKENKEGNTTMTSKESKIIGLSELLTDSLLNESELQRAEIVFATNDIVSRLGKMIEDLSKMGTDDIMPLVDGLRSNFGSQVAEAFSRQSEEKIQSAANGIDAMKSLLDSYRERLEGRISDEDAGKPLDLSSRSEEEMGGMGDLGGEEMNGLGDLEGEEMGGLGDLEGEEMEDEGPLGREKKAVAETAIVTIAGKRIKLTMEQVAILQKAKRLTEKVKALNNIQEDTKPETVSLEIGGKKFRITESQLKSLIFAKNFQKRVNEKKAEVVRLSESQAWMLATAKNITQKVNKVLTDGVEK